ncbi:MAG: hypothetical protein QGH25_19310 [Candidatus Latescibacteria bacterium]|nr:hypothetical protein [Candidatus Latescibacterota bacterium]
MPVDPTNMQIANRKIRDIRSAFGRVNRKGTKRSIVRNTSKGFAKKADLRSHFQGVARRDDHAYLTLSGKVDGALFLSLQRGHNFVYDTRETIVGYNHPGGIQTIGEYVAVPVYGSSHGDAKVLIYDRDLSRFSEHALVDSKAFCLGIANIDYRDGHGERYIMAVVSRSDGSRIDFYHSQPGEDLASRGVTFEQFGRWRWTRPRGQRSNEFFGHANSISLVVDEKEKLYLLGLHTIPKSKKLSKVVRKLLGGDHITGTGLGKDRAELFRVDLDLANIGNASTAKPVDVGLERLAVKKCKCHKAAFRFGASARVTEVDTMEFIACEAELLKVHPKKVQIDLFTPSAVGNRAGLYRRRP